MPFGPGRFAQPVEVTLTGHQPQGEPLRVAVNRRYLERVVKLGLGELHLFGRDSPLHARDEQRSYIWMPLAASAIVPPVPAVSALTRGGRLKRGIVNLHLQETKFPLDNLIVLGILGWLGWLGVWCYTKGKHIGSVKGYYVGRSRRRC